MRQQRNALFVRQSDDEVPQVSHVTRHALGPCLMLRARPRRQGRVFDPVRMASQGGHGRTNLKATGLGIAVEQLRGQGMGQRDQRRIGLIGQRHAKRQRPMRGQVAGEAVGNRLARLLFLLNVLHVLIAILRPLVLPGLRDGRIAFFRLGLWVGQRLILEPHETTFDSNAAIMVQHDERPTMRDHIGVVGRTLGRNRVDLVGHRLQLRRNVLGHFVIGRIAIGKRIILGGQRVQPRLVLVGQGDGLRIETPHPVGMRIVDMRLGPFPALGLHLARNVAQLFGGEHIEQAHILEEPATVLAEQVADDIAAGLNIGVGPDEYRTAIIGGHVGGGHVAPDDPRFAIVMQALKHLLLPGMVLGDGEGHKLIQGQPILTIDLQQLGADSAKAKPLLHHARRHAEPRADLLRAPAFIIGKLRKPLELVGGVHRGPGHVLVQTDLGRIVGGIQPAAHRLGFPDLLALGAQQHRQPAALASGNEIIAGRRPVLLGFRLHDKVLDQPLMLDRRGQRLDSGLPMRHLTGVARGLLELGERHENLDARYRLGSNGFGNSVHHTSPKNRTHPGMGWAAKKRPAGPPTEPGRTRRAGTKRK